MNVQKPNRELSIDETLIMTFDLYSKNFIVFFTLLLVSSLISGGFSALFRAYISTPTIDYTQPSSVVMVQLWNYVLGIFTIAILSLTVSWILNAIIGGTCIKYTSDLIQKAKANLDEAFSFTTHKLLTILGASLIASILTGLGLLALILPGIILALMFTLVVPAIINENVGVIDGLSRSKRLVDNRWLKTLAFVLIIGIIVGIVSFIGTLIVAPFGQLGWLASSIITAFVAPISPIATTVYYYAMVGREEQRRVPPPPTPPF